MKESPVVPSHENKSVSKGSVIGGEAVRVAVFSNNPERLESFQAYLLPGNLTITNFGDTDLFVTLPLVLVDRHSAPAADVELWYLGVRHKILPEKPTKMRLVPKGKSRGLIRGSVMFSDQGAQFRHRLLLTLGPKWSFR